MMTSFRVRIDPKIISSAMRFLLNSSIIFFGVRRGLILVQTSYLSSAPLRELSIQTKEESPLASMIRAQDMLSGRGESSDTGAIVKILGLFCFAPILNYIVIIASRVNKNNILNCWLVNYNCMKDTSSQNLPLFKISQTPLFPSTITVLLPSQSALLPPLALEEFKQKGLAFHDNYTYITIKESRKYEITNDCNIQFSKQVQTTPSFYGLASTLLASAFTFQLKQLQSTSINICLDPSIRGISRITELAGVLMRSRVLANGRGDFFSSPDYFVHLAQSFAEEHQLQIEVLRGKELKEQGLNLFHAVSRGSKKDPALISMSYRGDKQSEEWTALIGKGVCFDSGGLDLKNAAGLKPMFLDKSGACSCLASFEQIVRERLALNVTVTLGMVENFIGKHSYRPSDIIASKKGYKVEIADTDAEGRLVLADCMTWTQQRFKLARMIELSTLTYSCEIALGHSRAGLFGNSPALNGLLTQAGEKVEELVWHLPLDESHFDQLHSSAADFLSDANDISPGASIAAAFLEKFVEEGVEWVHLDVGGACIIENWGTGFGARLLLELAHRLAGASSGYQ